MRVGRGRNPISPNADVSHACQLTMRTLTLSVPVSPAPRRLVSGQLLAGPDPTCTSTHRFVLKSAPSESPGRRQAGGRRGPGTSQRCLGTARSFKAAPNKPHRLAAQCCTRQPGSDPKSTRSAARGHGHPSSLFAKCTPSRFGVCRGAVLAQGGLKSALQQEENRRGRTFQGFRAGWRSEGSGES